MLIDVLALGATSLPIVAQEVRAASPLRAGESVVERANLILLRVTGHADFDRSTAEQELAALGATAVPTLLEAADSGLVAVQVDQDRVLHIELPPDVRDTIIGALARFSRDVLIPHLESIASGRSSPRRREIGLCVLARMGDQRDFALLQALALARGMGPGADSTSTPAQKQAFSAALKAILERCPQARALLGPVFSKADPALAFAMLNSLESGAPTLAFESLARLLGRREHDDGLVLLALARVATRPVCWLPEETRRSVRTYLSNPQTGLARSAIQIVDGIGDYEAVDELVSLLARADAHTAVSARCALRHLTGEDFGSRAEAWRRWYELDLNWWEREAMRLTEQLTRGDASEATAAILDLGRRRFVRPLSLELLARGLERREPQVVVLACHVLGQLRSRAARPILETALAHANPRVRDGARAALASLGESGHTQAPAAARSRARNVPGSGSATAIDSH